MLYLVDGIVATGAGAFHPGATPSSSPPPGASPASSTESGVSPPADADHVGQDNNLVSIVYGMV